MPSPIGHALAGAAIVWSLDGSSVNAESQTPVSAAGTGDRRLTWTCVALAVAPDLDLLTPYTHRAATHSLLAMALVAIISMAVTGKVTGRISWRTVLVCTVAYGSHLLLDWLSQDDRLPRGLQLLWPFSPQWFISDWDVFRGTIREQIFSVRSLRINALAVMQEVAILGPLAALAWSIRVKTPPRFPAELPGGHHSAQ